MGMSISTSAHPAVTGRFTPGVGVIVVRDDDTPIVAGSGDIGFVAVPGGAEGYYKDEVKTAKTFASTHTITVAMSMRDESLTNSFSASSMPPTNWTIPMKNRRGSKRIQALASPPRHQSS